ncbi:MAG: glycoside hydrolase family 88 protein [Lachnospiraceae bacterium]|nr:glycoside hydrolase family 88 protein [Lachnospiraceae bacterium]
MDKITAYIDELLKKSTLDLPAWNIEKLKGKGSNSAWNYIDGCMIKAILEMYSITGEEKYFKFADDFIDHRVHEDGSIEGYDVNELNIDNINAGKILFELYDLTGKEKYRKAIDVVYSQIGKMPRTEQGSFWHKNIYPDQVWLDGLYMCQPFYMEYETRFNNKKNYDDIYRQFELVKENMLDVRTGLYYHAFDHSRKMFWCDKHTGLSQNFWLRAIGWFSMAMLDTLDKADKSDITDKAHKAEQADGGDTSENADDRYRNKTSYESLKQQYVDLMVAMADYMDDSGMWYQVVNLGGMEKNYLETSGSAIMAYSYLKGVRLGFLPEKYGELGKKAFDGICSRYLSEDETGLHLGGICLVGGLGGPKKRDGTFAYYMSEPVVNDDAKGVGPFLLAYTELLRQGGSTL